MTPNITCVLNAHREKQLIYPTLRSIERARAYAEECGISTSLLVILDNADVLTREIVNEQVDAKDRVLEVTFGDLSSSRNFAVSNVNTEYTSFLDGDDLWCRTWLANSYLLAESHTGPCILHPAYNVYFGDSNEYLFAHTDSESTEFSADFLLDKNYWTALSFSKTSIYRSTPYQKNRLKQGFGYEDWTWNWQTLNAGIAHKVVPQTSHYIRKGKDYSSLLQKTSNNKAIPNILELFSDNRRDGKIPLTGHGVVPGEISTKDRESVKSDNTHLSPVTDSSQDRDNTTPNSFQPDALSELEINDSRLTANISRASLEGFCIEVYVDNHFHSAHPIPGHRASCEAAECIDLPIDGLQRHKINHIQIIAKIHDKEIGRYARRYCPLLETYRDKIDELFFSDFYITTYSIEHCTDHASALKIFLADGIYDDHMPNPWFNPRYYRENHWQRLTNVTVPLLSFLHFEPHGNLNPCAHINLEYYKSRYAKDSDSPFMHYINQGQQLGYRSTKHTLPEFLEEETNSIGSIELRLKGYNCKSKTLIEYPQIDRLSHTASMLKQVYDSSIYCVICIESVKTISAMSLSFIDAMQHELGIEHVLICVTEGTISEYELVFTQNSQVVSLNRHMSQTLATVQRKAWALHTIIGTLCPKIVANFDSQATWQMYARYGKQLKSSTRLISGIRSFNYLTNRTVADDIVQYLPECIGDLHTVISDNTQVIQQIKDFWGYPTSFMSKFGCVFTPHRTGYRSVFNESTDENFKILWSIDSEQSRKTLQQVKDTFPEIEFVTRDSKSTEIKHSTENEGTQTQPIGSFNAFLTTATSYGLQEYLIDAAINQVPIIAARGGHNDDFISEKNCWIIEQPIDVDSITLAIKKFRVQTVLTKRKSSIAEQTARETHNWDSYLRSLKKVDLFSLQNKVCEPKVESAA